MTLITSRFPELTPLRKLEFGIVTLLTAIAAGTYAAFGTTGVLMLATSPFAVIGIMVLVWLAGSLLRAAMWTTLGAIVVLSDIVSGRTVDWKGQAGEWKQSIVHSFTDW